MPTLPTPATTGDVWGNQLNNFLKQLQSSADGSINYATTRPTKTASDVGYTMIDTTTREIIRWSGTAWEVLMGGTPEGRMYVSGDVTIYVRQDGNDNNDGSADTSAKAFKTIQKAVDTFVGKYDMKGFKAVIKVADSATPYDGFRLAKQLLNANGFDIIGNEASPANVKIQATMLSAPAEGGYSCVSLDNNATLFLGGFMLVKHPTLISSIHYLINIYNSNLDVGNLVFGDTGTGLNSRHVTLANNAVYSVSKNCSIVGSAPAHITTYTNATTTFSNYRTPNSNLTIDIASGVNFTNAVLLAANNSSYVTYIPGTGNFGFTGGTGVTSRRYILERYSYIAISNAAGQSISSPGNPALDLVDSTSKVF